MPREVGAEEFVARLGPEDRRAVQEALSGGMGVARFGDLVLSYGRRGAVIEGRFPPKMYGSAELDLFVPPIPSPESMRSPLLDWQPVPQISRPRVAPSRTAYPEVLLEARVSSHPRGNSEFLNLLPGRQEEEVPQAPLTEEQDWWAQRL